MIKNYVNGNYIVFENERPILIKGSMQVEDGIVRSFNHDDKFYDQIIDMGQKLITPVFCNLHLHLGEKFFRSKAKLPLLKYLEWTERLNKELLEDKEKLRLLSAKETIEENIGFGNYILSTLRGNDILVGYDVKAYAGFPIMKSEKLQKFYLSGMEGYKAYCQDCHEKGIVPGVFLHSLYYTDENCLEFAAKCHAYSNSFLAVHVGEDEETEARAFDNFGKSSLQTLEEYGLLNDKTALIHCCEYKNEELEKIASYGCTVVVCPLSNINLLQKPFNPTLLQKYNINWCTATDGLGSGETANLLSQAKLLGQLYQDVSVEELFKSITLYPCKFLGCENMLLGEGKVANFNVFDVPLQTELNDYLNFLIYNESKVCYTEIERGTLL